MITTEIPDRKWKVLIADDEFRIGILIQKLIRWDELDMECIGTAENGEKALEMILEQKPDIVITDIRMPRVSGLELISRCVQMNLYIRFIVISGYREFDYAHQAMKFGVEEYLLKPVNQEELNEALERNRKILAKERMTQDHLVSMQEKVSESERILRRDFLHTIIEQEAASSVGPPPVEMSGELYRGLDIKLDRTDPFRMNSDQDDKAVLRVSDLLEEGFRDCCREVLVCSKEHMNIYLLLNYDAISFGEAGSRFGEILSRIRDLPQVAGTYEVTIGIGTEMNRFSDIRFSILDSHRAVSQRLLKGTGRLIYGDGSEPDPERLRTLNAQCRSLMEASLAIPTPETVARCIDNAITYELKHASDTRQSAVKGGSVPADPEKQEFAGRGSRQDNLSAKEGYEYYSAASQLLKTFLSFGVLHDPMLRDRLAATEDGIFHCTSVAALRDYLKKNLCGSLQEQEVIDANESAKPVRIAQKYISEHYAEKITLEDVAEKAGLNPVYFSVLFKKETGENFSAYLLNYRMEVASKLLTKTNETVAAVGAAVGFKDYRYFSQTFQKATGLKPVVYRKFHS